MANHPPTDVVIDVRQRLSPERGRELIGQLGAMPGIAAARMSTRSPRLVLVDYDSNLIRAHDILATLDRDGVDARLVGI